MSIARPKRTRQEDTRLEPTSAVAGRSVFSRSVRQGTLRIVVSSWMPPELVSTSFAEDISFRKST